MRWLYKYSRVVCIISNIPSDWKPRDEYDGREAVAVMMMNDDYDDDDEDEYADGSPIADILL